MTEKCVRYCDPTKYRIKCPPLLIWTCRCAVFRHRLQGHKWKRRHPEFMIYEGWNFNSGNYLFTTDTK